jgi:hypothetical protein
MRIFIAGCARSGTSLTRSLMKSFSDLYVFDSEAKIEKFEELAQSRPEPHLVVKRTATSWRSLAELPASIGLLYCVRHPFDVLTSVHPETKDVRRFHVTPERWRDEYEALLALRARQPRRSICQLKYEELIAKPDAVQQEIARHFGLVPSRAFSADPANPIRATSLRKWEHNAEYAEYLRSLPAPLVAQLKQFCADFGYELPAWAAR